MKTWIIAVGSEMLTPSKMDTNSLYITERLNEFGYDIRLKAIVGDDIDELAKVLKSAAEEADLIVVTGGLGPTEDDVTREAVARVAGVPLDIDEAIVDGLRERFAKRNIRMTDNNKRQAMVPRGATVLENRNGSAPGLWLQHGKAQFVLLPGPPRELTPMFDAFVREHLAPAAGAHVLLRRTLRITGRPESEVDSVAQPIYTPWRSQPTPIATTILASLGQIELHLTASANNAKEAGEALDAGVAQLCAALGASVYSTDGRPLEQIIGALLFERKLMVAVAESCSGGLLASRLTDVPGSSLYFDRGVVCYSNEAKTDLVGVPDAVIREHGAVSEPVARAMADGIRRRASVAVGIGITGIAGPGGGTPEKPVGTVAIAVVAGAEERVRTFRFVGGREMIKFQSTQAALNMLRLILVGA
ncbi:MAG TPA: competence/damage-inducible protein A [Vicinamibacterales bacterium]